MTKKQRIWLLPVLMFLAILSTIASRAQVREPLRPPKGADVAIVVFEDLQCPDCARVEPLLQEAVRTYKVPLVRYDFPLPQHAWAREAAILARWFDTKKLGEKFRGYIFQHQREITPENLRGHAERFAQQNNLKLPFVVDPQGKFGAAVDADKNLGTRVGISHTPTIYVVSNKKSGTPFVEVVDRSQLFALIDSMKREIGR